MYCKSLPLIFILTGFTTASLCLEARAGDELRPLSLPVLTLRQFVAAVTSSNLDLAAQRYAVSIAQAQLIAARVLPNPTLNFGGARDISHEEQPASENAGLSELVELGGKRHFRVAAATRNLLATSATLDDFIRTLRGTAANAYIDAVSARMVVAQKQRAFGSLSRLAELNRLRMRTGDIAEVDYNQALVDSLQAKADVFTAEVAASTNSLALVQLLGQPDAPVPRCATSLDFADREFDLSSLIGHAEASRPDIVAARNTHDAALASARLAAANRVPDLTFSAALQQTEAGTNPINPSPRFDSVTFGVALPVPLFNTFRGEYLAASYTARQSERTLRSLELKAEVDVRQSYEHYHLARQRAAQYQGQILELAAKVLDAKLAAYKQGGATLLDVLNAQKAETDVRLAAIDALGERAKAFVALEQSAGIWDIE
ncbi:MAG: TolC family protein [Verrucomicrobia bacterium]|nr:TolC family protein [Verrucomicrobiota bacterium]